MIDKNYTRDNLKQIPHTYLRGDYITLKKPSTLQKLVIPQKGPYTYKVTKHNNNGSIWIEKAPTNIKMSMYKEFLHTIARIKFYHKQKLKYNRLLFEILI